MGSTCTRVSVSMSAFDRNASALKKLKIGLGVTLNTLLLEVNSSRTSCLFLFRDLYKYPSPFAKRGRVSLHGLNQRSALLPLSFVIQVAEFQ